MGAELEMIIDGVEIKAQAGQTIMEAADAAGVYIPRLCAMKGLTPFGSCRVCTVMVNGRPQAACTQPVAGGMVIESETDKLKAYRRNLVEMLFAEGNHFCAFCEKSGKCELQALAYRLGFIAPKYPCIFRKYEMDMSHPDVMIDRNRCVLCARCVRTSQAIDGKGAFGFVGRGPHKRIAVDAESGLAGTDVTSRDKAVAACPVGALVAKRTGYSTPVGQRTYDHAPIGSDIEAVRPG